MVSELVQEVASLVATIQQFLNDPYKACLLSFSRSYVSNEVWLKQVKTFRERSLIWNLWETDDGDSISYHCFRNS